MKQSRPSIVWPAIASAGAVLVLALLFFQAGRWMRSFDSAVADAGAGAGPRLAPVQAGGEPTPEDPAAQPLRKLTDEERAELEKALAEQFLGALRKKVQAVGAIENEAILRFKNRQAYDDFLKRASLYGLKVLGKLDGLNAVRVGYDKLEQLRSELLNNAEDYDEVGANYLVRTPPTPQTDASNQGGTVPFNDSVMAALNAETNRSTWGDGSLVGVVDTGVTAHATFKPGQVTHIDLVNDGQAFNGHGTMTASLVAGNSPYAQGVAPAARILDVRVADPDGFSDSFVLAQGIVTAVANGANPLVIALGSYGDSSVLAEVVADAVKKGVVIIASAGNEQYTELAYPARYEGVVSVGAVDATGKQASFSNSGEGLSVVAPGVGIPSAYTNNQLVVGDGTSQAAALVGGVYAATGSLIPNGTNILQAMLNNAKSLQGTANQVGQGMVQVPAKK